MRRLVSVVIPALNEAQSIGRVIDSIPVGRLREMGYDVEVIVVDGGSEDGTAEIARAKGARVYVELRRGYGRAYKTGFALARGDVIVTGDADGQYPFQLIPYLLRVMERYRLDFINTNRFYRHHPEAWSPLRALGNRVLSLAFMALFGPRVRDCQSGMWVVRRDLLRRMRLSSDGMEFSVEIKALALKMAGDRFLEVPIYYGRRLSRGTKLRVVRDFLRNLACMALMRVRLLTQRELASA